MDEKDVPNVGKPFDSPLAAQRTVENDDSVLQYTNYPESYTRNAGTPPFIGSQPKPNSKPFYKSKGFWGSVLGVASLIVPLPFRPIVAIAGSALGLYGRAQAQGPLDFSLRQQ